MREHLVPKATVEAQLLHLNGVAQAIDNDDLWVGLFTAADERRCSDGEGSYGYSRHCVLLVRSAYAKNP